MKAVVFYGKGDMRYEEIPTPTPGPGEILVKVMACGVCGTDVHIFEGHEGAAACHPPTVLGHEFSGVVAEIGANVTSLRVGDKVAVDPNELCGACDFCKRGQGHFCTAMNGYGTTRNGAFAEYVLAPAKQAYPFAGVSFETAAMSEPVSCCLHGMDLAQVHQGSNALIIGGGPIGLIMLQLVKLAGAGRIFLSEPVEEKRKKALTLGADMALSPEQIPKALASAGNIDCVFECVGRTDTMEQAIDYAGVCGTVMLFGLTSPDAVMRVKPFQIFKKELKITASFINPYTMSRAVSLLAGGKLQMEPIMAEKIALSDLPQAFRDGKTQENGKRIVKMEG